VKKNNEKGVFAQMIKRKMKLGTKFLCIFLVIFIGIVIYNIYDNNRFIVVEEKIVIDRLPKSFENFKILQISDLHGAYFGKNQENLIKEINKLDYDMIAFTGDMNSSVAVNDSEENSKAILKLIDGIKNKEYMFWVDGNAGPYALENVNGAYTGELTDMGKVLNKKGVKILALPYSISRGKEKIWITPEMSKSLFEMYMQEETPELVKWFEGKEKFDKIQTHYKESYKQLNELYGNGEVKIMLNHYPKQLNLTTKEIKSLGDLDYELILAGHYHGGQWRLPFIGALYIPSPTAGVNGGYFPAQHAAKGLSYYGNAQQYVSAGLGASSNVPFTNFRLFNTPEINLITLKNK